MKVQLEKMMLQWLSVTKTRNRSQQEASDEVIDEVTASTSREIVDRGSGADSTSSVHTSTAEDRPSSKKPVKRKFNPKWLEEFSWLELNNQKMVCSLCTRASKRKNALGRRLQLNNYVKGSNNFQR